MDGEWCGGGGVWREENHQQTGDCIWVLGINVAENVKTKSVRMLPLCSLRAMFKLSLLTKPKTDGKRRHKAVGW